MRRVCCPLVAFVLASCDGAPLPAAEPTRPAELYQQLISHPAATAARDLQGVAGHQPGYSIYLRFRMDAVASRDLLHDRWRTVACSEVEQRLQIQPSQQSAFQPGWQPLVEMSCRCYEGEFDTAHGRGHHVLLLDETGLIHVHGASL